MMNKILRPIQAFWTLLIMALVGNMISSATHHKNPSVVNYQMFVAVFSMLSLIYLTLAAFDLFGVAPIVLGLDFLNTLFFLCGGIALAAKLGVHSCNNQDYIKHNGVTNSSPDMTKRCHEAQATAAFLWFGFVCYAVSLVFSGLAARRTVFNIHGSIGRPSMSQVA